MPSALSELCFHAPLSLHFQAIDCTDFHVVTYDQTLPGGPDFTRMQMLAFHSMAQYPFSDFLPDFAQSTLILHIFKHEFPTQSVLHFYKILNSISKCKG